jgi:hypothetical protein
MSKDKPDPPKNPEDLKTSCSVSEVDDMISRFVKKEEVARKRVEEINSRVATLPVTVSDEAQARRNNCTVEELPELRKKFWSLLDSKDPEGDRQQREQELLKKASQQDVVELIQMLESETQSDVDEVDDDLSESRNESEQAANTVSAPNDDLLFPPLPMNMASLDDWVEANRTRVSRLFLPILKDL